MRGQSWTRAQINIAPGSAENNSKIVLSCGKNSNGPEFPTFGAKLNIETMIYEIDPDFDLEAWQADVAGKSSGKNKVTPEDVATIVADLPLKRKELVAAMMEEFGCEKSTAYGMVGTAQDKNVIRLKAGKYEKA